MFNAFTSSNVPQDFVGLTSFFDFLCAIFSRIAYTEAPIQLFLLSGVFRIIPEELIMSLGKISNTADLKDDDVLLQQLNALYPNNTIPTRNFNGKNCVDIISYVSNINTLIEYTSTSEFYDQTTDPNSIIISVADSNYGDAIIIGSKKMPNLVWLAFRGTYSTKTAQSYAQMSSLNPVEVSKGTKLLKGIAKIEFEILHTLLLAMNDVATNFLQTTSVIPAFTGHSLGGGLATILGLEYCVKIDTKGPQTFSPFIPVPACITFGAPRVLSKTTSERLCNKIVSGNILFHRFSNYGDPVTALPPPGMGFYHPCSSGSDKSSGYRKLVSRDCDSSTRLKNMMPRSNTNTAINCSDVEASAFKKLSNSAPNMLDHMTYLYVSFIQAANIAHLFGKSAITINTTEIGRVKQTNPQLNITKGDSELRIVRMVGNNSTGEHNMNFIDLVNLRAKTDKILYEDTFMNKQIFSDILQTSRKQEVTFNANRTPIPFDKSVEDSMLDQSFQKDIQPNNVDSFSSGAIELPAPTGGRRRKHYKTRKPRKSRKSRKSRRKK